MPLIDPRSDPRLAPIPHPALPTPVPPIVPVQAVPGLSPNVPPPAPPPPGPVPGTVLPPGPEPASFLDQISAILNAPRDLAWSAAPLGFEGQKQRFLEDVDEPIQWLPGQKNSFGRLADDPFSHLIKKGFNQVGGAGLAFDMLGDPLTYILNRGAIGSVGQGIGKGIEMLPGPTKATADSVVRALNLGDKYLNDAAELPIKGALWAGGKLVKGVTSIPKTGMGRQVLDAVSGEMRPASSLYDWATSKSPQTALRMIERQLSNVNKQLRDKGHTLELGVSDWQGRAGRPTWPGTWSDAGDILNNLRNDLNQRIIDAASANPHTADIGHQIVHEIDAYRNILNKRFRDLQAKHTAAGTPASQAATELQAQMQESWQALTDMTGGARDVFEELAGGLMPGPQMPGLRPEQISEVSRKLQGRMEQLKYLHHDLPGFLADLPNQFRNQASGSWYDSLLNRSMTDYATRFKDLGTHLNDFEQGLRTVWEQTHPGRAFPKIVAKTSEDRLAQINGVLGQMNLAPVDGAGGLFQRLAPLLPVTEANKLKGHLGFWGEDFLSKDLFDTVKQRIVREHAKRLNITVPAGLGQVANDGLQFWKTQALDTPAYLLNNLMGGLFMGGLRGVSPMQVMRGLTENIGTAWRGGDVHISPLARMNELLGTVTPHEVTSGSGTSHLTGNDDVQRLLGGSATNIMERIGTPVLGALGAAQGAYSGFTGTPKDADDSKNMVSDQTKNMAVGGLTGAAAWGSLPVTTKYLLTRLGGGLESVMRQAAHLKGLSGGIEARAADLQAIAANALPPTPTPAGTKVMQDLAQKNGFVSPAALEDMLVGAGTAPDLARQAGKQWQDAVQAATTEGARLSHQIHFDYEDLNNVEELTKRFMPFATWGMKAYPFFAEELAKNPRVMLPLLRLTLDQQAEQEQKGLPGRFSGTSHVPALDSFWSAITGQPEKVYINPLKNLFPFSDIAQLEGINENQTPLEKGLKGASALGMGIRPDLEAALGMTPLMSGDSPAKGFWRHSGAIQGATGLLGAVNGRGVDMDAPIKDIQRALRMAFRGLEPTDTRESGVLKTLDEMSLRDTGHPIASGHIKTLPYLEARYTRQGSLWDKAHGEASRESSGRSLFGLLTQIGAPRALLGQEEEKIRGASAKRALEPEVSQELKRELQAGNRDKVRADLVPSMTKAAFNIRARYGEARLPKEVEQILLIPTVANLDTLRGWIAEEEQTTNPLNLGYSSGGSPEEVRLSSALTAYYSIPLLLRQDPAFKNLPPEELAALERNIAEGQGTDPRGPYGRMQTWAKARKEQFLASEPTLAAYLKWQQSVRGYGNPRQFIREVWGDPVKRQALANAPMKTELSTAPPPGP